MKCREIIEILKRDFPENSALPWDNVGLLAGRDDCEVDKIYVAVDATDEVVEKAVSGRAGMLITHHPLIFGGIKKVTNEDFIGRRLVQLIQNDISYYAMHTNYDVLGMADLSADMLGLKKSEVLEVTEEADEKKEVQGIGRVADLEEVSLRELCEQVKSAFDLSGVQVFGDLEAKVHRIAVCPGSGKSVIDAALAKGAGVLITGDIGHHEGIDAVARGLFIIDAGHYGMEHIFVTHMVQYLKENLPGVEVTGAPVRHPFVFV